MTVFRALVCVAAFSTATTFADEGQNRAAALRHKFMAPCCWSETLAEHRSPTASELNSEIDKWITAGLSDAEIEDRVVSRYGRRILAEPGGAQGAILRVVPFLFLGAGAVWVLFLLRRWMRPVQANVTTQ